MFQRSAVNYRFRFFSVAESFHHFSLAERSPAVITYKTNAARLSISSNATNKKLFAPHLSRLRLQSEIRGVHIPKCTERAKRASRHKWKIINYLHFNETDRDKSARLHKSFDHRLTELNVVDLKCDHGVFRNFVRDPRKRKFFSRKREKLNC